MADSELTTQQLIDYLHTAISENDLLYVHWWLKELEDQGEEGREAIRTGKHSWKQETVIQALLEGNGMSFEGSERVKKLIFWMLSLVQERSSAKYERIQLLARSSLHQEETTVEGTEDQIGCPVAALIERAEWLIGIETEEVADWIDKNRLRPPDSTNLTGCNPLPDPPPLPVAETAPRWKKAVFLPLEDEDLKQEAPGGNTECSSNQSEQSNALELDSRLQCPTEDDGASSIRSSVPLTTSTGPPPSSVTTSLSPTPFPPKGLLPLSCDPSPPQLPPPLPQSIIAPDPAHAIRISSVPESQQLYDSLIETIRKTIEALGERVMIDLKTDHQDGEYRLSASRHRYLSLQFETRMAARLAVEELRKTCPNPRSVDLETDYQEDQQARLGASKRPPSPTRRSRRSRSPPPPPRRHSLNNLRRSHPTRPSQPPRRKRGAYRQRYRSRSPRRLSPPPPRRRPVSPPRKPQALPPRPPTVPERPEVTPVVENDDPRFRPVKEQNLQDSFAFGDVETLSSKPRRLHWDEDD
ncbi:hypothetical protein JCM3765_002502 [Sporobolomyces pararoseus]